MAKTILGRTKIRDYLSNRDSARTAEIAEAIGLSITRTKELLYEMPDVEAIGENRNRTYRLKQQS